VSRKQNVSSCVPSVTLSAKVVDHRWPLVQLHTTRLWNAREPMHTTVSSTVHVCVYNMHVIAHKHWTYGVHKSARTVRVTSAFRRASMLPAWCLITILAHNCLSDVFVFVLKVVLSSVTRNWVVDTVATLAQVELNVHCTLSVLP
jgi:hypothetical protein